MVNKCVKNILKTFEAKNFTQSSTNSEISRCSYGLEKWTFCLETFFSKVSKKFFNGLMILIFSLRYVFILVLDSCKIWRSYEKNSRKYSEKSDPPQIAIWGGVCKYIACLTRLYLTWISFFVKNLWFMVVFTINNRFLGLNP